MVYREGATKGALLLAVSRKHLCDSCASSLSADTGKQQQQQKKENVMTHVSTNFGGSYYCTKFLWDMALPHLYGQMLRWTPMRKKWKRKKKFFYNMMSREITCQKMTNCLVAKCALISVRYTFLTHSHTWEYKALRRVKKLKKKKNNLLKTYMLMLINDCTHACVMTSVLLW